jgi:hypothetical protein
MDKHGEDFIGKDEKEFGTQIIDGTQLPRCLRQYSSDELASLEKKLVRKIDLRLLPILITMFLLNVSFDAGMGLVLLLITLPYLRFSTEIQSRMHALAGSKQISIWSVPSIKPR